MYASTAKPMHANATHAIALNYIAPKLKNKVYYAKE
jgi:hypothetical protein